MTQSRADALAGLDVFVGEWVVVARFAGGDAPAARSTFEWALDRPWHVGFRLPSALSAKLANTIYLLRS